MAKSGHGPWLAQELEYDSKGVMSGEGARGGGGESKRMTGMGGGRKNRSKINKENLGLGSWRKSPKTIHKRNEIMIGR